MSNMARFAILLTLSLSCAGLAPSIRCQTKPAQKLPPSSVSGRVTIHGKGAPGIIVGVRSADFSQPSPGQKATTDQDGNYRITDLAPGNYRVSTFAPAYVNPDLAISRGGKLLLLASGEEVPGIDFLLLRGGVITGKVRDSSGQPLVEERLNLINEDQANGRTEVSMPMVFGMFQTDDRGVYRIYGVPPGRYKISVGLSEEGLSPGVRPGRVVYKRTFYPSVTDAAKASVVEVSEGSEVSGIDITVEKSLPGFGVSGKIMDEETGQPVAGMMLGLRRIVKDRDDGGMMGVLTASNSRGEFRMENIIPGTYAIFISPERGSEMRADGEPFEIIDQDVTGRLVKTVRGLTLSGTVALDGTFDKSIFAKLTQLRVQVYVMGDDFGSGRPSDIGSDGSFRLGGLAPGAANFALTEKNGRQPSGFTILRLERDGVVLPRGLEIKTGEPVTGVKLVVSYGSASIRGEVKLENGPLPPQGRILVWIKKVGDTGTSNRMYSLDARGRFLIESLAAGSYEIGANVSLPGQGRRFTAKQVVEVSEGTVTDVALTVDLKANPE